MQIIHKVVSRDFVSTLVFSSYHNHKVITPDALGRDKDTYLPSLYYKYIVILQGII